MKFIDNIEMSHVKEVVISHKVFYVKNKECNYDRDSSRMEKETVSNTKMPKFMTGKDMSDYVREYIGRKKWTIAISDGTINIFKRSKKNKHLEKSVTSDKNDKKQKKNKKDN